MFADDIVFLAQTVDELPEMIKKIYESAGEVDLDLNFTKTEQD